MDIRPPRFPADVEHDYRLARTAGATSVARAAALFAAFVFLALGLWDELLDPGSTAETMPYRVAVAAGFLLLLVIMWRFGRSLAVVHVLLGVGFALATVGFALIVARIDTGYVAGVPGFIVAMSALTVGPVTHRALLGMLVVAAGFPVVAYALTGADATDLANIGLWMLSGAGFVYIAWRITDATRRRIFLVERALEAERDKVDGLMRRMVPDEIADRLQAGELTISDRHEDVTVLFADLVGFTRFAESHDSGEVVGLLNTLFSRFDELVGHHSLEKIKTMGDGYMVAGGAPRRRDDHAAATTRLAIDMLAALSGFRSQHGVDWELRIGIHTGPVVAGVIGTDRFAYDMWGDTVNVASRLESTGAAGSIHVSSTTAAQLGDHVRLDPLGPIALKNRQAVVAYRVVP